MRKKWKNEKEKSCATLRHRDSNPGRWIQSPPLYQLSYRRKVKFRPKILGILGNYVRENEANLKHFTK